MDSGFIGHYFNTKHTANEIHITFLTGYFFFYKQ